MTSLGLKHLGLTDKSPRKKKVYKACRSLGRMNSIIFNLKLYGCKPLDTVMKGKGQGHD